MYCAFKINQKLETSCRKIKTTGGFVMYERKVPKQVLRKKIINEILKLRSEIETYQRIIFLISPVAVLVDVFENVGNL